MSDAAPDHAPLCAPPDREPRPPRTAFPPLACDTHAHIFEARFPYAKERIYTPPDSNLSDYRHLLRRSAASAPCWCSRASMAPTTPRCWPR